MNDLTYKRILSPRDADICRLLQVYKSPSVSKFLSIGDDYFNYVTSTENVFFYKIYKAENLIGAIHLEKHGDLLYMSILVFPEFQRTGIATKVIEDIKNDIFELNYKRIDVSIDESNLTSIRLFEKAGFSFVSKEDELMNFIYEKD